MSLTGTLLDVSGSMESNVGSGVDEQGGPWVQSIFQAIDDLIEHDISCDENKVFAIGFGSSCSIDKEIFDIIGTIQQYEADKNTPATETHINEIFCVLEKNGARNIRKWANRIKLIQEAASDNMAVLILRELRENTDFLQKFVYEFLPPACRDKAPEPTLVKSVGAGLFGFLLGGPVGAAAAVATLHGARYGEDAATAAVAQGRPATKEEINGVINKAESYLRAKKGKYFLREEKCNSLKEVGNDPIYSVQDASRVLRGCVGEKELSKKRSQELLKEVEPVIYGRTPLYQSLDIATRHFQNNSSKNKMLFLLSDGIPSDGSTEDTGRINQVVSTLERASVQVVSCFISTSSDIQPKRLYDEMQSDWEPEAKFLFSLSSKLSTQLLPRAILIKRGWTIDVENNETRLFIHVNHPDHLREACKMAREVVFSADALSDLLVSVDLDMYINQSTGGFKAKDQVKDGTCYAHAAAAVLHLAMKRILGREGGYPDFERLKDDLIKSYGDQGADTFGVLQEKCPKYRLHSRKVSLKEAKEAIVKKRPVVARFYLTDNEWDEFERFYKKNPTGVLTRNEVNIRNRPPSHPTYGHAVVLTTYNSKCLTFMNSWGDQWADKGFFRVESAEVLNVEFIDVYWKLDDLTDEEKKYYREHGAEVANTLMTSLKGLQKAKYMCPRCRVSSPVTGFTGTLSKVRCPRCSQQFSTNDGEGNILALNIYLTSVAKVA